MSNYSYGHCSLSSCLDGSGPAGAAGRTVVRAGRSIFFLVSSFFLNCDTI